MTSFARTTPGLAIATLIAAVQLVQPAVAQTDDGRRSGGSFYAGAHGGYMFGTANASLGGRLGYDIGAWTPYLTGGLAWLSTRYSRIDLTTGNEDANPANIRLGYTVGAGIDYRLDSRWSTRAEYLYTNFNLSGFVFGS